MNTLKEVLTFLSLPCDEQLLIFPRIPHDKGKIDNNVKNPLRKVINDFFEAYYLDDESSEEYLKRNKLKKRIEGDEIKELTEIIELISNSQNQSYLTRHYLHKNKIWNLVRKLSKAVINKNEL